MCLRILLQQRVRIGVNRLLGAGTSATAAESVFEQACKQLFDMPAYRLRQASASPHLAFDVALHGEHVVGEAGPYRAFFADVCAEVLTGRRLSGAVTPESVASSALIPLFVTVPNAQMSHGENRDRWLIRYSCNTQEHLKHFEVRCGDSLFTPLLPPQLLRSCYLNVPPVSWSTVWRCFAHASPAAIVAAPPVLAPACWFTASAG